MDADRKAMLLAFMGEESYRPMKFKQLCGCLGVRKEERQDFSRLLGELISDGSICLTREQTYRIPKPDRVEGVFSSNSRGFGFVRTDKSQEDIFISPDDTMNAMDGDTVNVQVLKWNDGPAGRGKKPEGKIISITHRAHDRIVGTYQKAKYFGFVVPDNQKIGKDVFISKEKNGSAADGCRVVVRILDFGNRNRNPEGEVIRILGRADDARCDAAAVAESYGISQDFPGDVLAQAASVRQDIPEEEISLRKDFRNVLTITIDGEDAKDLDDAISLEKTEEGFRLGVHIADVSHYVQEGSPLDREALNRGTSVYLIDTVLPMLPKSLSNGICSLNEGADRLTLSCLMDFDHNGRVTGHEICESVICSDHRMSYKQVGGLLEHMTESGTADCRTAEERPSDSTRSMDDTFTQSADENICTQSIDADTLHMLYDMKELSDLIRKRRQERGGIDFDFPESKIVLGEDGVPICVSPYEINDANRMIEDFMLMANETIAEDYFWQEMPFIYRSHESPDPDKIEKLGSLIRSFGYSIHTHNREIHPMELQKLLGKIDGMPEAAFLSRMVLRSMKRAAYTTDNPGHFGLAASYYCHFTSPIRRYPDLQIHRIIKENLHGKMDERRRSHYREILPDTARASSAAERRADDAERALDKIKKAEYLSRHIGEEYDGRISGISGWGFFVELDNTCEGMVRLEYLDDDYYVYDQGEGILRGVDTERCYRIGDPVRIQVLQADLAAKIVYFAVIQ